MWTKDGIIEAIQRCAEANGGVPLGRSKFLNATGIKESDWIGKYWPRWSDAVRAAGYEPNIRQPKIAADELFAYVVTVWRELGHFPTTPELRIDARNREGAPSKTTLRTRFGTMADLRAAVTAFAIQSGDDDLPGLDPADARRDSAGSTEHRAEPQAKVGYVYLFKSGPFYKIGRSNSPARRRAEIGSLLPEVLETLHVISTDDPVGIERYWHQRFDSMRERGEWFRLDAAAIKAFKRRKFM